MKIFVKFLLISCFNLYLAQITLAQINYENTFVEALEKAKNENKLVFVKYYGESCSHCKQLQEVLNNDTISKQFNEKFVSFKINSENLNELDHAFLKKYKFNIDFIPYMFFFDAQGEFIHFATPSQHTKGLLKVINDVETKENRSNYLKIKYENGDRDIVTLKMYIKLALLLNDNKLVDQLGNDLFVHYQNEGLYSKASFLTLAKYIKSIENGLFIIWINNFNKLDSLVPEFKLEDKEKILKDILVDDINERKLEWNITQLQKAREYVKTTKLSANYYSFTWLEEVNWHSKNKEDGDVVTILNELIVLEKNFSQLVYIVEEVIKKINNPTINNSVESAIKELEKQFITVDQIANIYLLKLKLYKKSAETKKFNETKLAALEFFKTNSLDTSKLNI
jgi:hypothetical protein